MHMHMPMLMPCSCSHMLICMHALQAGDLVRSFLWDEYADWYIEVSKRRIAGGDPVAAAQARRTLAYP
jgi:valyl-tRNA synthetase